jgi:carbon-monoxide dehydrogenase large subunit
MELADYSGWREEQTRVRREGRYVGIGTCLVVEPSSSTRMGSYNAGYYSVRMRMDPNGKIAVFPSGSDEGQGHATSISRLVADELRVAFDDICCRRDSSLPAWPYSAAFMVGPRRRLAARQLEKI